METDAEFHSICDEISDKIDLRLQEGMDKLHTGKYQFFVCLQWDKKRDYFSGYPVQKIVTTLLGDFRRKYPEYEIAIRDGKKLKISHDGQRKFIYCKDLIISGKSEKVYRGEFKFDDTRHKPRVIRRPMDAPKQNSANLRGKTRSHHSKSRSGSRSHSMSVCDLPVISTILSGINEIPCDDEDNVVELHHDHEDEEDENIISEIASVISKSISKMIE